MTNLSTFARGILCGIALLRTFVEGSPLSHDAVPRYFRNTPFTRREISVSGIEQELGPLLSPGSAIFLPSDPEWSDVNERWNTLEPPDIEVVVQPAKESDVPKIVRFCNDHSLEFLAVNRGHGFTTSLGAFKGVQIDLKQLTDITIDKSGKYALFQGGVRAKEVMATLWDHGYVTATGSAECVGIAGPALGGGHGRYEGLYGLVSDNIIHLNLVLADGSMISVNETSHSDLLWAMKGAGHNFGIVTSLKLKIYPKKIDTWHYHNYFWTQDKLETVLGELNKLQDNGKSPVLLGASYGQIYINQSISKTQAMLWWTFAYAGPASEAEKVLRPFNKISAVHEEMGDVSYPEIVNPQNTGMASCGSAPYAISTILLQTYNITTERKVYDLFNKNAALYPELGEASRLFYEGYAVKGMQAVDPASTAYPHRDENHLVFYSAAVPEGSNLRATAETWAKDSWDLWTAGQPTRKPAIYVNYATGNKYESLESIYGYESWRLDRLRGLKKKYDPHNRFRFYVPIVSK
ncbi:FAD-binding domain-containing protein [Daldinia caldariorum]|uniref:FAD-binding domain-containing protein n=1 Tax=Daldinia caldariorum TaxID=326644 RepID=UPI0020075BBF|nr:FAD-binding domain-containing protein [Daldinia caldariorum]KAI1470392.1 FAD-binding domain-containing protein [Daldinia caldariorum]